MATRLATSTTLTLHDGALRIVVVADTHGKPHAKSAQVIAAQHPDHVLHAGDIGDLQVLDRLATIAPLSAVRGNIDAHDDGVPDTLTIDVCDGAERLFKMLLLHIGVNGPRLRADVARLARAEGARIVVCGHSHVPFIGRSRDCDLQPGINRPAPLAVADCLRRHRHQPAVRGNEAHRLRKWPAMATVSGSGFTAPRPLPRTLPWGGGAQDL